MWNCMLIQHCPRMVRVSLDTLKRGGCVECMLILVLSWDFQSISGSRDTLTCGVVWSACSSRYCPRVVLPTFIKFCRSHKHTKYFHLGGNQRRCGRGHIVWDDALYIYTLEQYQLLPEQCLLLWYSKCKVYSTLQ